MLHRTRKHAGVLARIHLALYALVWISVVAAPCAMALQAGPAGDMAHACPHCPPLPCAEVAAEDCDNPALDPVLSVEKPHSLAIPPPAAPTPALAETVTAPRALSYSTQRARAGPRAHLVHVQFNE